MPRGVPKNPAAAPDGWGYRDDAPPVAARAPDPPAIAAAPPPAPPAADAVIEGQCDDWEPHFGTRFHRGPCRNPTAAGRARAPAALNPEIARRYQAGESMPRIARELGTTVGTVANRLRLMGVPSRERAAALRASKRGPKPKPLDVDELLRLRREGASMAEIARRLGAAESTIRARLVELRRDAPDARDGREGRDTRFRPGDPPPVPRPGRPPKVSGAGWGYRDELPAEWAEIARRYRAGESLPRISREMGIIRQTIRYRLAAMGIARRDRTEARRAACVRPDVSTADIVEMDRAGVPKREIARRLGISPRTVRDRLAATAAMPPPAEASPPAPVDPPAEVPAARPDPAPESVPPARPAAAPPAEWDGPAHWLTIELDLAELVRLYVDEGLSCRAIGERLGVSRDVVRVRLLSLGVARRLGPRLKPVDDAEAERLYAVEGLTLDAVATRLGLTYDLVRRRLIARGVAMRGPGRNSAPPSPPPTSGGPLIVERGE